MLFRSENRLNVKRLGRGCAWMDTGTVHSLMDASAFVKTIEEQTGVSISAVEEIAYNNGWIDTDELMKAVAFYRKSSYGKYLENIADGKLRH